MQTKRHFLIVLSSFLHIGWTLLLILLFGVIAERIYTYAEYIAIQNAKTSVNKDLAYRTWVASHGGVYVPVTQRTQPNPYLSNIKDRDIELEGRMYTLMNPAYTLSQMMRDYSKLYGVKTHITSKFLRNPNNKPDIWETVALDEIEKSREQFIEVSKIEGDEYLRLMNPLITKKSCLKCHAFQGYKVGDIRGGVSVSIPMKPLYRDAFKNSMFVAIAFMIIWILGLLVIRIFRKKIATFIEKHDALYEEYIYGFVNILEKRDTYTAGHSARVARYSKLIAQKMLFSEDNCKRVHKAGMLHDIGKIAIPDNVFLKPSKLSQNEYKLIQEHVSISYEMLNDVTIFDDIKEIVRDHHEHYDGSGYPRGLQGEDTPILAQILSLADAFDAMTTDRIYKGRKTVQEAVLEISKFSGKQFNPTIVKSSIDVLKDIVIDSEVHQNPSSLLEEERFSYFYKDSLTGVYNEQYLQARVATFKIYNSLVWISLGDFHHYNKKYGWKHGNKALETVASALLQQYKTDVYRFYGDNFLVMTDQTLSCDVQEELEDAVAIDELVLHVKSVKLESIDTKEIKNIDELLTEFF